MSSTLIVYYSRKGENYWNGSIRKLERGNTEIVAEMIAGITGGDLFEVETAQDYPADYHECVKVSVEELRSGARPELKRYLDSLDGYDTVFVGYPCWCGTMPMAMFTFLERYDLSGKKILPFCTNEGSGMGRSESDLRKLCPDAIVEQGLSIHGAEAAASKPKVERWLQNQL